MGDCFVISFHLLSLFYYLKFANDLLIKHPHNLISLSGHTHHCYEERRKVAIRNLMAIYLEAKQSKGCWRVRAGCSLATLDLFVKAATGWVLLFVSTLQRFWVELSTLANSLGSTTDLLVDTAYCTDGFDVL